MMVCREYQIRPRSAGGELFLLGRRAKDPGGPGTYLLGFGKPKNAAAANMTSSRKETRRRIFICSMLAYGTWEIRPPAAGVDGWSDPLRIPIAGKMERTSRTTTTTLIPGKMTRHIPRRAGWRFCRTTLPLRHTGVVFNMGTVARRRESKSVQ